ncbi:hypothetical protein Scep_001640 [Stephania cephalantha]|uniref:Uncharacterized protein n=1 Tax=Stephania cephalantha TaxID=152367 RepID=A0AAP0Q587_9MAGN
MFKRDNKLLFLISITQICLKARVQLIQEEEFDIEAQATIDEKFMLTLESLTGYQDFEYESDKAKRDRLEVELLAKKHEEAAVAELAQELQNEGYGEEEDHQQVLVVVYEFVKPLIGEQDFDGHEVFPPLPLPHAPVQPIEDLTPW